LNTTKFHCLKKNIVILIDTIKFIYIFKNLYWIPHDFFPHKKVYSNPSNYESNTPPYFFPISCWNFPQIFVGNMNFSMCINDNKPQISLTFIKWKSADDCPQIFVSNMNFLRALLAIVNKKEYWVSKSWE
jgi:hypothetical protein